MTVKVATTSAVFTLQAAASAPADTPASAPALVATREIKVSLPRVDDDDVIAVMNDDCGGNESQA